MPNLLTAYVHHHAGRVAGTLTEGLTWLQRLGMIVDPINARKAKDGA